MYSIKRIYENWKQKKRIFSVICKWLCEHKKKFLICKMTKKLLVYLNDKKKNNTGKEVCIYFEMNNGNYYLKWYYLVFWNQQAALTKWTVVISIEFHGTGISILSLYPANYNPHVDIQITLLFLSSVALRVIQIATHYQHDLQTIQHSILYLNENPTSVYTKQISFPWFQLAGVFFLNGNSQILVIFKLY